MADQRRRHLEICVDSAAGVAAAIAGGADRIELCSALAVGGLTPSAGLVDRTVAACKEVGVAVRAMVRPRGGDFAYDRDDLAVAVAEARALLAQGVDGLVFGAARHGRLDAAMAARWIGDVFDAAGRAVPCTFHRAIDVVADPVAAVLPVVALGFDHILTSGGAPSAQDASATIRAMIERADGRIVVMPGSGVTPETLAALVAATGASAVHASASRPAASSDDRAAALGFTNAARETDPATVRSLREALDRFVPIVHLG